MVFRLLILIFENELFTSFGMDASNEGKIQVISSAIGRLSNDERKKLLKLSSFYTSDKQNKNMRFRVKRMGNTKNEREKKNADAVRTHKS